MEKNYSKSIQESKFNNIGKRTILFLAIICCIGLIIRLYYTPYEIPVNNDAFSGYFLYALHISILGHLPPDYTLSQSGWGEFLSLFFMNFHSDNLLDYTNLQRTISVILSGITVVPIFFICKKFFNNFYSLIGAIIFAFEPRIILNSTLGISEPLYILVISLGILFFLNLNKKIIYLAFGFIGWATIIRPEGQFWFITFSIIFLLRFRKKRKDLLMYIICIAIFLLVLSPIVIHRIECCETDAIVGRILIELSQYEKNPTSTNSDMSSNSYGPNLINGIKLFGWSMIPIFIIFVPFGLISIFKHFKFPEYFLIIIPSILFLPIIYSTSIAPDTRYVYPIFPILCVISVFGIKFISSNLKNEKILTSFIIIGVVIGSILFLDLQKTDYDIYEEGYSISKIVIDNVEGVNKNTIVTDYFKVVEIENKWPITETSGRLTEKLEINRLSVENFNSLNEFIEYGKGKKLTHLIIDNEKDMPKFLMDVFNNEKKYEYLIKEFDSQDYEYNYHVKKFRINYNALDTD